MAAPIRVLHVDDDPDFADVAATRLEREADRLAVETAIGAEAALERLREGDVDCVVSDYDMPDRSGIEFLREVRASRPDLPFILFTGKGSEEVASDAVSAGVTDYLQKGTKSSQYAVLANRIENAVEQYRSRRALAKSQERLSLFIDQSPLGVIEWDDNFEVVQCNSAAEDILGYREETLLGESWEAIVPESDREQVGAVVEELLAAEGGYHSINTNCTKAGERIICEWHNRVITDENGEVVAIFSQFQDVTDRETQKKELRRKERRYEAVFNDPNIIVGLIGTDGTVLDINETAMEYVDADLADVVGEPFWTTPWFEHDEATRGDVREWVERAASGEYVEFEAELRDPGGDPYSIEGVIRPVNDDGEVVSLLISARDVTERTERERRLREEQQFVKSIFDALPDPLYAFDVEGDPLRWNDQLEAVTGYDGEEIEGMSFSEFVPEIEADRLAANFERILETGQSITMESAVATKDGHSVPYELTGAPLEDADGTLRGVTGVGRDITERKERERQLKALNETAQELIAARTREAVAEQAVLAARDVLGLDANAIHLHEEGEGLVPYAQSESARQLVGPPPTFTQGDSIAWRVFESGEALALDDVQSDEDAYNEDTPVQSELFVPIGDRGILIAGSPTAEAFDDNDLVLGEILAGTVASALEQVQRTEQLQERERELTRQNERLEEFTSVVSHDLRNPLQVAQGQLALLEEEVDSEHLGDVSSALERMDVLIEDLLTLAREGEDAGAPEAVDLAGIAEGCWRNVATGEATIETDVDREIRADPSRLQQLLENLMRNAIDHAGPEVTVTIGTTEDGFYVADDGPGIPESEREAVFKAGYSTAEDGAGFGLAIVAQVAEAHDWTVGVTEGAAGGARFEFGNVAGPE